MKLAFVFPGQGSQSIGMMNSWQDSEVVQAALRTADEALNQPLSALIASGEAEQLNLTTNTQPAMLVASYAMYQAYLQAGGQQPALMAGHSLGEYTALTAAGSFQLADAVRLVRVRADAMQGEVPVGVGGMAAIIGLQDAQVQEACQSASSAEAMVEPVNFNAPGQVVIAGHSEAVARACEAAKALGAKRALVLPVSAPFHSQLLKPVGQVLEKALAAISIAAPQVPVLNNVDVKLSETPEQIVDALSRQAWRPVRWVETIQTMKAQGVTHIVECGPGKVLAGLIKRIEPSIRVSNIVDPASLQATLQLLSEEA